MMVFLHWMRPVEVNKHVSRLLPVEVPDMEKCFEEVFMQNTLT